MAAQSRQTVNTASIGDRAWLDRNANGLQDVNESGLSNVQVTLYDESDSPIATTTTDAEGHYLFEELAPGSYTLAFQSPDGYYFSENDVGHDDTMDSDFNPVHDRTDTIIIDAGEVDTSWDAGFFAPPRLSLEISDNDLTVGPGDRLVYSLNYINEGKGIATGTTILMVVPEYTSFDAAASATGWHCRDGGKPDTICELNVGTVESKESGSVDFTVIVEAQLPDDLGVLYSQAIISEDGTHGSLPCACLPSINTTPVLTLGPPTAITLLSFDVTTESNGIHIHWMTGAEIDSWGFYLYRSADGRRENAQRVNADMIPSQGGDGNIYEVHLAYEYRDSAVVQGVTYTYWLVEVGTDGKESEHGPVTGVAAASQLTQFYLPIIRSS